MSISIAALMATLAVNGAESVAQNRLADALEVLVNVPSGRVLSTKAVHAWNFKAPVDLLKVLKWGSASKTDAVLTRRLDPKTGKEYRERVVTVYIRDNQTLEDIVLDIAHELVHATSRPSWDPYDPKLTVGRYVWLAIEGEGGEVDAVVEECRVGFELYKRFGASLQRCQSYLTGDGKSIDRNKVRKDFYRVGNWNKELVRKFGSEIALFPFLTAESPRLYSSTGHAPYPAALSREFEALTAVACENTRRRVEVFAGRRPASEGTPENDTTRFLSQRCK